MSSGDRRAILWMCCAAVCWRGFVGLRAPAPGVDACRDLWLAQQVSSGHFGALLGRVWEPLYGLLLAPSLALGATPFIAAQVAACLLGGLAIVPIALAAERLREGAGVSAGAIAMVASGPVVAAGAGAATSLLALIFACSLWAFTAQHFVMSGLLCVVVVASGFDEWASSSLSTFEQLRLGIGMPVVVLPLLLLPPRSRKFLVPAGILFAVLAVAAFRNGWVTLLPMYSAVLCVLCGLALARISVRLRDLCLCLVLVGECHSAWTLGEERAAVVERVLPDYLDRNVHEAGQSVLSTIPRLRWAAGQDPSSVKQTLREMCRELSGPLAPNYVGSIVMTATEAKDSSLRALLAARYERAVVIADLQELLDKRGLTLLRRRHE